MVFPGNEIVFDQISFSYTIMTYIGAHKNNLTFLHFMAHFLRQFFSFSPAGLDKARLIHKSESKRLENYLGQQFNF